MELPALISAEGNYVKNLNKSAPFHNSTFYNSVKTLLEDMKAVFVDHELGSALQIQEV